MLICPNCSSANLDQKSIICADCGWAALDSSGLPDYFTEHDRNHKTANDYINNYEELAVNNIENSNIDRRFLKNQAKNLVNYLSPIKGMDVCDLGIGQGFLCDELVRAGVNSVAAVDVSRSYLEKYIRHKTIEPFLANAEYLPFKNEFDLIVSTDVMEHVINVGSFLFCINRALKKEGIAAIRVPYREGLLGYSPHSGYGHLFGHLRSFNKEVLKIYMEQAGFEIKSFHLDGYSTGTPQPYLYCTDRRKNFYHKFLRIVDRFLDHSADATLINPCIARIFMKPAEMVVVAVKKGNLDGKED